MNTRSTIFNRWHVHLSSLADRMIHRPAEQPVSRWQGLWLSLLLAWLLLAIELAQIVSRAMNLGGEAGRSVGRAVLGQLFEAPRLQWDIATFIAGQLLLHALLGLGVWLTARATARVFSRALRLGWIVSAWWAAIAFWIYVANSALYVDSMAGPEFLLLHAEIAGGVTPYHVYTVALALAISFVLAMAALQSRSRRLIGRVALYAVAALCSIVVLSRLDQLHADTSLGSAGQPHVILIGIDSLRADMVATDTGQAWYTPNVNAFLREAQVFPDAITPLARTFPSWMSILTGRHPVSTRARENLVPYDRLDVRATLADRLRQNGYRTVYATDDVRFSNIDQRYGFDEIIGPPMGASDFLLGSFNDIPLANLVANTRLAAWLFPNTYSNRAAEVTYRPSSFIDWLERDLEFAQPTFLSIHLTLPHFPYSWAHESGDAFSGNLSSPYPYLAAVVAADRQFAEVMKLLERRGALENAIVVVLSDHGEGLGLPVDNLIAGREAKAAARIGVWMWGHGTSVLSPGQYSVVLGFRRFDSSTYAPLGARHSDVPASLEDIAPTVLELAGIEAPAAEFDGMSLVPALKAGDAAARGRLANRVRFTESGINVQLLKDAMPDKQEFLTHGAYYFEVDRESSRVQLKSERWAYLLFAKERAAIRGDWLLAAIPTEAGREYRYVIVNRRGGLPRVLAGIPDPKQDPVAAYLWDALQRRYPGELVPFAAAADGT